MTEFILNDKHIKTQVSAGMSLLNFIRENENLKGTKSGCKEGDCGACTVLIGAIEGNKVKYKSVTSCLTPLGSVNRKHVVTIEGLTGDALSPVQTAIMKNDATQCGFCTPGIVTALTGYILNNDDYNFDEAINSISGNICRCTGYKSIERAVKEITEIKDKNHQYKKNLPSHFFNIAERLRNIKSVSSSNNNAFIAGGTDLLVQQSEKFEEINPVFLSENEKLRVFEVDDKEFIIGGGITVSEFMNNSLTKKFFSESLLNQFLLISSEQIRNTATFAGNIVNASPIGDVTVFLLAMNAFIKITNKQGQSRTIALKNFYKGYKDFDLQENEIIESISFETPEKYEKINFEKVSKREYLDIASVNTTFRIKIENSIITKIQLSAGGIAPFPFLAEKTIEFLIGKEITENNIKKALQILDTEIKPISDIRGSEKYKRLLLRQLFLAHFNKLYPEKIKLSKEFFSHL